MTEAAPAGDAIALRPQVLIIGGGINGCGLFRDLAEQGVDVLLVERGDFCSGASAAPSRLIHGGIKYLETGEFRLVAQSARERNLLLCNAPHYVKPLETFLPVHSLFGGIIPSIRRFLGFKARFTDRGAVITRIGLLLYDLFGRHFRTMPRHRMLWRTGALAAMAGLTPRLTAIGIYHEAVITHAERLGLELLLDGERAHPAARALNYVTVRRACAADNKGDMRRGADGGLVLTDAITGAEQPIAADVIVNAGGAWIDSVNAALGISSRHIGGTKGSHIIVRNDALHSVLAGRMVYFGTADGRINLLFPFMGNVLVGSSDIPVADPDKAVCSEEEIAYFMRSVAEVFPTIAIGREQVAMSYSGVRPLPRSDGLDPGEISRDHSIATDRLPESETPVLALIGGKWTTFRGFSAEVADRVLALLRQPRRISTERLPIGGGRDFPVGEAALAARAEAMARAHDIGRDVAVRLFERYGTTADALLAGAVGPLAPLAALPTFSRQEIDWICRTGKVRRLDDILFRRTDIALSGALSADAIIEIADIAAAGLGWSQERRNEEIAISRASAQRHHIPL